MRREIMWTEESEEHIWARHQVTPAEVEEVVNARPRLVEPGRDGTELVFGTTDAGAVSWSSWPKLSTAGTTW